MFLTYKITLESIKKLEVLGPINITAFQPWSPSVDGLKALGGNTKSFDEILQVIVDIVKKVQL